MSSEPSISGKRLIKVLSAFGFETVRIKGSHHFIRHPDGRTSVVPVHSNEDISKGLFRKILKDCEITLEEFLNRL
jgi:predicted RNA binding protein YcfA (HicA-like mRNA interferase family)